MVADEVSRQLHSELIVVDGTEARYEGTDIMTPEGVVNEVKDAQGHCSL